MNRRISSHMSCKIVVGLTMFVLAQTYAVISAASSTPTPVAPVPNPCPASYGWRHCQSAAHLVQPEWSAERKVLPSRRQMQWEDYYIAL